MIDDIKKLASGPTAIMGSALAATALSDHVDWLPKGPAMMVLGAMAALVSFFVKRDYTRINGDVERHNAELIAERQARERSLVDTAAAFAARCTALEKAVMETKTELLLVISNCVKVPEAGTSSSKIYDRINRESHRITVVETELGLHRRKEKDPDDQS